MSKLARLAFVAGLVAACSSEKHRAYADLATAWNGLLAELAPASTKIMDPSASEQEIRDICRSHNETLTRLALSTAGQTSGIQMNFASIDAKRIISPISSCVENNNQPICAEQCLSGWIALAHEISMLRRAAGRNGVELTSMLAWDR